VRAGSKCRTGRAGHDDERTLNTLRRRNGVQDARASLVGRMRMLDRVMSMGRNID
jgi:hypothetical protein